MKKIKLILAILTVVVLMPSCEDDGGKSKMDFEVGAVPNVLKAEGTEASMNIIAINNGVKINLGVTVSPGQGDIASIDIVGFYKKTTTYEKAYLQKGITTFPTTFKFDQFTLMNAFTTVNSASDFTQSSSLIVSAEMTLKDGRVLKMYADDGTRLYGADIANSAVFKVQQTYLTACTLTDASTFNGNYKVVVDDWADYAVGATVPVVYNPANGTLKFRVMNSTNPSTIAASASNYLECTLDTKTATVTVVSNAPYLYGAGAANSFTVAGTGTVGTCNGDINLVLTWTRASGSFPNQKFNLVKL
ncbi:hypothetical protein SAMN05443549_104234 [Flavobacterium fluvii]|uniref:DUF1735 domain-containing protein n=1 Tax=Flavobacterium fluvii TaxID=468056 RepID=A0A1M5K9S2_9FLAO|nr:hypothetical protein [Flavobacterium fluvii]SHG49584.1 hypothetical protein SAMN05443549_104234 [Flavobacterium fluvii]